MPNWKDKKYSPFKTLIETYVSSLNERALQNLTPILADDVILSRGLTCSGKENVISHLKNLLHKEDVDCIKFELLDSSMGFFNRSEAQILLYMQIYHREEKREIHIESLLLVKKNLHWLISRIFGLGFEPEEHNLYFKPFLEESEKGEVP